MIFRSLFAAAALSLAASAAYAGGGFTLLMDEPAEDHDGVITEFFAYESPQSHKAWQSMSSWAAQVPGDVEYERVPFIQSPHHALQARGYYASLLLAGNGDHEAFQRGLFESIHVHGEWVTTDDQIVSVAKEAGYNADMFRKVMYGAAVGSKVDYAKKLAGQLQPRNLPTVVVDGRFRTDPKVAGGGANMVRVLDGLVRASGDSTE